MREEMDKIDALMRECRLCPRNCGVDRLGGQRGYCRVGAQLLVARAALHMWEEPCISGQEGSGTVFFPVALWDVNSARTGRFREESGEKKFP